MTNLGRLEKIENLRDIWRTEDQDFTPWLAQEKNISLLGDTLGLDLEVEAQEKDVGSFRADILCKDTLNDSWVVIENQFGRTNHDHLGKLLTYAAGLKAVTIVWIAERFADEHRAALDWLNSITDDAFRFFALEVELWRIGDSPAAPKFNVVSKPNAWTKTVGEATRRIEREDLSETKKMQLHFWEGLHEDLSSHSKIKPQKSHPQHWSTFAIGRSGMRLHALINTQAEQIGIEFQLHDGHAKSYFRQLEKQKNTIEQELGSAPIWMRLPEKQASRIVLYRPSSPLSDQSRWEEYRVWMREQLEAFDRVFRPRVKALNPDEFQDDRDDESE